MQLTNASLSNSQSMHKEQCKEINQLRASLGISAGLLGSTCRQVTSLQNELCCQKALKDKADLEVRQLANRLGELQQEVCVCVGVVHVKGWARQ